MFQIRFLLSDHNWVHFAHRLHPQKKWATLTQIDESLVCPYNETLEESLESPWLIKMSLITLRLTKSESSWLARIFMMNHMTQFMSLEWVINLVRITTHLSHEVRHKTQNGCEVSQNVCECTNMDDDLRKVLVTGDTTLPITHTSRHYNFESKYSVLK